MNAVVDPEVLLREVVQGVGGSPTSNGAVASPSSLGGAQPVTSVSPPTPSPASPGWAPISPSAAPAHFSGLKPSRPKVKYTHDAMIDLMLMDPSITQDALAEYFGYSPGWISLMKNSDAFQARYAQRRQELVDPVVMATIEKNLEGMASRSMDILRQKLDRPAEEVPDNLALRALEISTKALGYGAKQQQPPVQVNMDIHLEQLAGNLTHLLAAKKVEAVAGSAASILSQASIDMEDD